MSDLPRVSYVVEGPTDYLVLDAIVGKFLKCDYVSTRIQPPLSEYADDQGPLGGGWRGVLSWCAKQGSLAGGLSQGGVLANCDYLVVHVDADIARESDLLRFQLLDPDSPSNTCSNIRVHLASLLSQPLPQQVVLCAPAQATEAWVFVALYTNDLPRYQPIEDRADVARLLIGRPGKLVRDKDGAARKQPRQYENSLSRITANWAKIVANCEEARHFDGRLRELFAPATE